MTATTLSTIDWNTDHSNAVRVRGQASLSIPTTLPQLDQRADSRIETAVSGRRSCLIEPSKLAKLTRSEVGVGIQSPIVNR